MAEAAPSEMPLPPPTNTPTPSPTYTPTRQTAALPVCQKPAEIAPSELVLAYVAEWDGDLEIYSTTATRSVTRQITRNHWHDTEPQYSPDGEWLAWRGDARVQLISFAGLDDRWLTPDSLHPGFDWSPDSTKIVYTGYDNGVNSLWLKDVETGRGVNLTGSRSFIPRAPLFSPEGDRILFHVDPPDGTDPAARWLVVSSDGASLWQLSFPGVFTFDAVWHLDG